MYFILSKLLLLFILPVFWVICLVIYAFYIHNKKKRYVLLGISGLLLYAFSIPLFLSLLAGIWDAQPNTAKLTTYSSAIVLGGFVSEGENGKGCLNPSEDRYFTALRLLHEHHISHLLITGGNASLLPNLFSEAEFIRGDLKKRGIPDSVVLIEPRARNTFENAAFSKIILQKARLKPPYILVTSAFHMRRALLIFKKTGVNVIPYPCDYKLNQKKLSFRDLIPAEDNLILWNTYIKEIIGYVVARVK